MYNFISTEEEQLNRLQILNTRLENLRKELLGTWPVNVTEKRPDSEGTFAQLAGLQRDVDAIISMMLETVDVLVTALTTDAAKSAGPGIHYAHTR